MRSNRCLNKERPTRQERDKHTYTSHTHFLPLSHFKLFYLSLSIIFCIYPYLFLSRLPLSPRHARTLLSIQAVWPDSWPTGSMPLTRLVPCKSHVMPNTLLFMCLLCTLLTVIMPYSVTTYFFFHAAFFRLSNTP